VFFVDIVPRPVMSVFGIVGDAAKAAAPLPFTYPVSVAAPDPPLGTVNTPLTWVVRPILPHAGAVPTPPEIRALPVVTSGSLAKVVVVSA